MSDVAYLKSALGVNPNFPKEVRIELMWLLLEPRPQHATLHLR